MAWFGDLLVLAGAALYGCSNVAQEVLLQGKEENPLSLSKLLWSFFPTRELLWLPTRTDRVRKFVRAVLAANGELPDFMT